MLLMGLPILSEGQVEKESVQMPATSPHEDEKIQVAKNLAAVKRRIGVHSGKGGVGKTFVAANVASSLAVSGHKVGLFDADIDCPNIAKFFNLKDVPLQATESGRILPLIYREMKVVSSHFLTENPELPMIVRGPIKHKVLSELLTQVEWGELDALIIDLPPGTADVPMSSMLIGNLDGIIFVTTPQKESLLDAKKSVIMAKDLGVPILGIVENMSGDVFGQGRGADLANDLGVPFLGSIPLSKQIRVLTERGRAALVEHPEMTGHAKPLCDAVMGREVTLKNSLWKRMKHRWN